jgi:integrase
VTISGREHYLGPHGTKASHVEYDRLVGEWLAAGRPRHQSTPTTITVVELAAAYWRFVRRHYVKDGRPSSEQHAIAAALRPLKALYGHTNAAEFGPLGLKTVRDRMVTECKWSRGVVNANVGRVRRMFKWGASEQLIDEPVWRSLATVDGLRRGKTKARETAPILPVADEVVKATLPYLPPIVADMVRLQRATGCRPAEVCLIRPCDVETKGQVWRFTPVTHKTEHLERARIIFIGPKAQGILGPYLLREKDRYCFSPRDSERQRLVIRHEKRITPLHWGNRPGTNRTKTRRAINDHYHVAAYRRAITRAVELANHARKKAAKEAGNDPQLLPHWHPNQMRHSAASEIRARFGLDAAATVLGHSKPDTTLIYAERDLAKAAAVMREVG